MTRTRTRRLGLAPALLILGLGAFGLGACGRVGSLQQPGPLFGADARADADARSAAREADRNDVSSHGNTPVADQKDPNADNAPRTRRDVQAPEQRNVPITQEPIPGTPDIVGPQPPMQPPGGH